MINMKNNHCQVDTASVDCYKPPAHNTVDATMQNTSANFLNEIIIDNLIGST